MNKLFLVFVIYLFDGKALKLDILDNNLGKVLQKMRTQLQGFPVSNDYLQPQLNLISQILNQSNVETSYCRSGKINYKYQGCDCRSIPIDRDITKFRQKDANLTFQLIQIIMQNKLSFENFNSLSKLLLHETNDTCVFVEQEVFYSALKAFGAILDHQQEYDQQSSLNIILSIMNIRQSWLEHQQQQRILLREKMDNMPFNSQDKLNFEKNESIKVEQVVINQAEQYLNELDVLLDHGLTIISSTFSNKEQVPIIHANLEIIISFIYKDVDEQSFKVIKVQERLIKIPSESLVPYLDSFDTITLIYQNKPLEDWKCDVDVVLMDNRYTNMKFWSKESHLDIFQNEEERKNFNFTLDFQLSLTKIQECFCFNQTIKEWNTNDVNSFYELDGHISCQVQDGKDIGVGYSQKQLNDSEEKMRQVNLRIGLLNFIIIALIYIWGEIILYVIGLRISTSEQKEVDIQNIKSINMKHSQQEIVVPSSTPQKPQRLQRQSSIELEDEINVHPDHHDMNHPNQPEQNHAEIGSLKSSQELLHPRPQTENMINIDMVQKADYQIKSNQKYPDNTKTMKTNCNTYVCCLFPSPGSWVPSQLRFSVIFLWMTSYQLMFAIFQPFPQFQSYDIHSFIVISIAAFILSDVANYVYALIIYLVTRFSSEDSKHNVKFGMVSTFITINLLAIFLIYMNLTNSGLETFHALNLLFQITFNMIIFDLIMDFISLQPKSSFFRNLRRFKLIEFQSIPVSNN